MRAFLLTLALLSAAPAAAPAAFAEPVATAAPQAAADRFIAVEGGRNFRDVGDYATADGHVVRRGLLYRSGSLGSLTLAGQQRVAGLGITSIIDLRTTDERNRDNSNWLAVSGLGYWKRDYAMSMGDLGKVFGDLAKLGPDQLRGEIGKGYRSMPKEQAPAYRELFARLVAGKGPVVVNCSAGKDRTGIASALVLTALGVPYDTVRQDYLLSNDAPGMGSLAKSFGGPVSLPPEVTRLLLGVDGSWLDAAFDQIRLDHGSVEGYLRDELGVGPRELARLRKHMLGKRTLR